MVKNCSKDLKNTYWSYAYKAYDDHYSLVKDLDPNWIGDFSNQENAD